jgi:RNase H-fold protein (predicted Holliday junction resolvase)
MPSKGQYLLGIDPGRAKCGLALVHYSEEGLEPLYLSVIPVELLEQELGKLRERWGIDRVVLGDGTGKSETLNRLVHYFSAKTPVSLIDERNSSCEARGRYWQENPQRGLWRLIPCSLRVPPEPYDQYVALILIERYLEKE